MTAIKARPPTGRVPWPLILVEGGEKTGKSWLAAEFSACDRIGQMYWLDFGEGAADEYGAIPGARYLVLEHDGSWSEITARVDEVREEARRAADAGEPPVVLTVDSMTAEWELLKDWATARARKSTTNKQLLAKDPHAEINVSMNYWNDAAARHRRLMTKLMTFPGIVVITARGGEVVEVKDGKPVEVRKGVTAKTYRVEGNKSLAYDASVWIRLSREHPPFVVGARSVHVGLRPGVDDPKPLPDLTLEKVVFDILRCDPATAQPRDLRERMPDPNDVDDPGRPQRDEAEFDHWLSALTLRIAEADKDTLRNGLWREVTAKQKAGWITAAEAQDIGQQMAARAAQIDARAKAEGSRST